MTAPAPQETERSDSFLRTDDAWAILIGAGLLALVSLTAVHETPTDGQAAAWTSPLKPWISKPGTWHQLPTEAFRSRSGSSNLVPIGAAGLACLAVFGLSAALRKESPGRFAVAFLMLYTLAVLAYLLAGQSVIKSWSLSYALWALLAGLVISNTIRTPQTLKPALRTELYIKTGLVLLGAEALFGRLLAMGIPGVCIAWVVTPIVLITTFWFGQRILKIRSASLNMVISADMSVCGVSAAIATAAACRAKKEELSTAIGLSLMFTVVMMAVMPAVITATGMNPVIGGAWMGGTIDATGAVAAAGELVGETAGEVAATVKMIQNILIGVIAFGVSVYWARRSQPEDGTEQVGLSEIWKRFPKFVLGFFAASVLFSLLHHQLPAGDDFAGAVTGVTKTFRGWFFCLAFVSIGLETDFRTLAAQVKGGRPLLLYLAGQSLNLILTLLMAWLMYGVVFSDLAAELMK